MHNHINSKTVVSDWFHVKVSKVVEIVQIGYIQMDTYTICVSFRCI